MAANSMCTYELKLEVEKRFSQVVLRGEGRITAASAEVLSAAFRRLIPEARSIVLDLTHVSHVDDNGLNALLGVYISVQRAGCQLELSNPLAEGLTSALPAEPEVSQPGTGIATHAGWSLTAAGRVLITLWEALSLREKRRHAVHTMNERMNQNLNKHVGESYVKAEQEDDAA